MSIISTCLLLTAFVAANSGVEQRDVSEEETPSSKAETSVDPGTNIPNPHHEMTVTATRTPTKVRELGRSVTVISAQEIENLGSKDLSEVLKTVTGFNVVQAGSFGGQTSLFVRGGESNFNLVLVDGVQVNQPGGGFDFSSLSTSNIDKIEIVRGPASVLYGANAATSVINIITRKGQGNPSGHIEFQGGNHNSYLASGAVRGSSDRFNFSLAGLYSDTDGIHEFNSQWARGELSLSAGWNLTDSSALSGSLLYTDGKQNFPTDDTGAVVDPNDYRETNQTVYSIRYENRVTDLYDFSLLYGYTEQDSTIYTVRDDIVDFFDGAFPNHYDRHFFDWQNNVRIAENNRLAAGVSYERDATKTDEMSRRSVGAYVQDQVSWNDRTFLTAGIRYDDNNRFENFVTGNVDLAYLVTPNVKVRGSVGKGLRAPGFSEIFGFPGFGITGNPGLKPEGNVAIEGGIDYYAAGGKGYLLSSIYSNHFKDLIEFSFLVPPGSPNYVNIEKARSRGLELEGSVNLIGKWWGGFNYTYTSTKVTDAGSVPGGNFVLGDRLLRRPAQLAMLNTDYRSSRLKARVQALFKGERDDRQFFPDFSSTRITLPAYWTVDFNVSIPLFRLSPDSGEVSLIFRGQNLFDTEYTEIAGFESPGRTLWAGLILSY